MSLSAGMRLGPYEILALLGVGGMGEVYRATDTHLKRAVAIKVLPESVAGDTDRLARFQREAEILAALNHPNIAGIFGLEKSDRLTALVMELVEGDDLSALIARGPIPLADAMPIAKQIADALEAAHEQGIVHRDLKPANVKVRADGTVKVLDFGLAKAMDPSDASSASAMNSPTMTARMTQMGMILGTAAYMAPEQAKGKSVDRRADIWAFGVMLLEMLTGEHPFLADTIPETLAHVMTRAVDLSTLPASTPRRVRDLLARCLEKDPKKRLRDIGEARIRLEEVLSGGNDDTASAAGPSIVTPAASRTRERIAWGTAAAFALLAGVASVWALRPVAASPETRLEITTPATDDPVSFAISPDGRQLVFVASATGGQAQLWRRPLDQTTAEPLAGTEGARFPFWSPDSRSVAFFTNSQLKRLDIGSGLPQTLSNVTSIGRGGSWSADGVIVFSTGNGPLFRVPATGGTPAAVTKLSSGQGWHRFPCFLPDGRRFVFYANGISAGLYLGSLDSPQITHLAAADTSAQFMLPNWLLFLRQGTLFAQHIDLVRNELTGAPVSVIDQVANNPTIAAGAFSVASAGSITYRTGSSTATQFTWFDRSGKAVGTIGQPDTNSLLAPTLSPDGRRVVAYRTVQGNVDLWLFDSARMSRLTFDAGRETYPVWSPDGSRIVFSKDAAGLLRLYQKPSTGGGQEDILLASTGGNVTPQSWSRDGRFLIYLERNPETAADLWVLPLDGKQKPSAFLNSKFEERMAQFSPDGRWVAYGSDESGLAEIYLRPFPASSGQWQVSTLGGVTPRWRRDGKELYYISPDAKLMAVPVFGTGTAPEIGTPMALFQTHIVNGGANVAGVPWQYDVAPDGRFLINVVMGDAGAAPITVIQNWAPKK